MAVLTRLFGKDAEILTHPNFQILMLATITTPLGVSIVSPLLDTLTGTFSVSANEIGLMISAFFAPTVVMTPITGILSDRYGRKYLLTFGLIVFGCSGALISLTTEFWIVIVLRVMQGVGAAAILPVVITSIGDIYHGSEEATAQGIRLSMAGLTQTISPLLAGVLVLVAWQYPLLIYAVSIPIGVLVFYRFEEPSDRDSNRSNPELIGHSDSSQLRQLLGAVRRRHVIATIVAFTLTSFLYIGFLTFNSFIVAAIGGTPKQAGVVVAVASLSYASAGSQAGRITNFFASRRRPLVLSNATAGFGMVLVGLAQSFPVVTLGAAFIGIGMGPQMSMYRSILTGVASDHLRGGIVSIGETASRIGVTLSPVIMGFAIEAGSSSYGFTTALRWTNIGVGITCGLIGIVSVTLATAVSEERSSARNSSTAKQ